MWWSVDETLRALALPRAGYAAAGVKIEPSGGVMYSMGIAFCRCPGTSAVTHCGLVATAALTRNENYSVSGTFHGLPWPKRHWAELSHHG